MGGEVRRVGVVGAGVSGVAAAAHLKRAGLDVTVFERSSVAGGVWVFDRRLPPEPHYPSTIPSQADFSAIIPTNHGKLELQESDIPDGGNEIASVYHAPPGPCYEGLSNNVPTSLMEMKLNEWRPGTTQVVNHKILAEYIQDTASKSGVDSCTLYNTRVEHAFKQASKWYLETSTLNTNEVGKFKNTNDIWEFDAVVIATGHYHACRVPDIPGLKEWKRNWPARIMHSKGYRNPQGYKDQNVLLVGASVSSTDIAKELGPFAKTIYQSSRGGRFDLPAAMLPENALRVGEILSFNLPVHLGKNPPETGLPIPGTISLADGTILEKIDRVLVCTGYHFSLPFLREHHRDSLTPENADEKALVTNGEQLHNLHKDIFYIPDPTLSFVGIPFHVATFTLFEFQAIAIAAVYSRKAKLPVEEAMRAEYRERVATKGCGKGFHSLKGQDVEYANSLVEWINRDSSLEGGLAVEGHTQAWHDAWAAFRREMESRLGLKKDELNSDRLDIAPDRVQEITS